MIVKRRKGQASAGSAALLVAIIAAMILLYTLFLPPDERAKLLEETSATVSNANSTDNIFLKESPGRLDLIKQTTIEHKLSSFNLLSKTEGRIIKEFDGVYAERTIFTDKPQTVQFDIADPENTDNILLSFSPKDIRGRLIITLNDAIISEKEYSDANPSPIKIPKASIRKTNTLKFQVSKPGILFFLTNKYTLENVKVFGDVTDKSGLTNSQEIFFTTIERQNLEKAKLSFMPTCRTTNVGRMDVTLNNQIIYTGIPDCTMPVNIEVSPGRILEGENNLKFTAEKGSYIIDQVKVTSNLKDSIYPTYYFNIDKEVMKSVQNGSININMSIIFVKSTSFQDVEVEINGRQFSIDNKDRNYMQTINAYIREDNNAITMRPLDGSVDIVELKIFKYYKDEDNT